MYTNGYETDNSIPIKVVFLYSNQNKVHTHILFAYHIAKGKKIKKN